MKRLVVSLLVVLAGLALVAALGLSEAGSRRVITWVDSMTPVDIDYGSGSLLGQLHLRKVSIAFDSVAVEAREVGARLRLACLWRSEVCVALTLADAQVEWDGGRWSQGLTQVSLAWRRDHITLGAGQVAAGELTLATGEAAPPTGFAPPQLRLPLALDIAALELAQLRVEAGAFSQSLAELALSARWSGADVSVTRLHLTGAGLGRIEARGTAQLLGDWPLAMEVEFALDDTIAVPQLQGRGGQIGATGSLADLELTVASPGAPDIRGSTRIDVTAPGLPYRGYGSLTWPQGTAVAAILPAFKSANMDMDLAAPLTGVASGQLLGAHEFQLGGRFGGEGYADLALAGTLHWDAPRLQVVDMTLSDSGSGSHLALAAEIELAPRWSLRGQLDSAGFTLPESLAAGRVNGALQLAASGQESHWQLAISDLALQGQVAGLPAAARGNIGIDSALRLQPGRLEGQLNGTEFGLEVTSSEANLDLELDSLGRWIDGARGRVTLAASTSPVVADVVLEGTARSVVLGGASASHAQLDGRLDLGAGHFQVQLAVPEIEQGERQWGLAMRASGAAGSHQLQLSTNGEMGAELHLTGAFEAGRWEGELAPTQVRTSAGDWQLSKPVGLHWQGPESGLEVAPHCWQHPRLQLCSTTLALGQRGTVHVALDGDADALQPLLPRGMQLHGQLRADLEGGWQPGAAPSLDLQARAEDLQVVRSYGVAEQVRSDYERVELQVQTQAAGDLAVTAVVQRGGREVVLVNGTLPPRRDGDIDLVVAVEALQLASFTPWFPEVAELQGRLSGTMRVSGPVQGASLNGALALSQGRLAVIGNPTALTELEVSLNLENSTGAILGSGLLGGGAIRFSGPLQLRPALSLSLTVAGDRHEVLMPPASAFQLSEQLQLEFSGDTMAVSGDIVIHEGVLRHQELPAGGVAVSDDVVLVDVEGNIVETERPLALQADVSVRVRDRFRVEGDSVQAVLGGDLRLRQTPATPLQLFGTLNLLGGELRAYNQALQIQRGSLSFSGPPDNPELNISAERAIRNDDVIVGARLSGSLSDAELEVYSDPPMSQGEAMSYLVRGRGLDAGAGADGTALALAVGANVVNRSGIVAELNRMPLLSDVAFGSTGEDDGTAATVSGYIGNRIYVSYGIGIYEPINVFTARLYLQSRLWLEVVSRLESSVDLYYSFDID